ncbi:GIY-YIG nuclease family protein [Achromobacter ruhlandii]|uniref:GIY-YIG nuclease family protein n=1 Tax=Achromobacter ruhlandii TaxID=72557 RepID=UPI003BA3879B
MLTPDFLSQCANSLRSLANDIQRSPPPAKMEIILAYADFSKSFPQEQIKSLVEWAGKSPVIYKFALIEGHDYSSVFQRFKNCKQLNKSLAKQKPENSRAYCKENQVSSTLYVGSSRNLECRLGQHFGYKARTTYSMQLTHWLQPGDIEQVHLSVWHCEGIHPVAVQTMEDHLWDVERPMLGKRGGR